MGDKREEYLNYLYYKSHIRHSNIWNYVIAWITVLVALLAGLNSSPIDLEYFGLAIIFLVIFILYLSIRKVLNEMMEEHRKIDRLIQDILIRDISEKEILQRMEEMDLLYKTETKQKKEKKKDIAHPHKIKVPKD